MGTTKVTAKFNGVDEYFRAQTPEVRKVLEEIRQLIIKTAPEAEEVFSYQMPAFRFHGMLIWYAAFKNHYSLTILPRAIVAFKEQLKPYKVSKGGMQIPLDNPLPVKLIEEIIKFRMNENLEKSRLKELIKSSKKSKAKKKSRI
jgi:uncharacterized protein YdhG (YjbR/CyaY superfamily)